MTDMNTAKPTTVVQNIPASTGSQKVPALNEQESLATLRTLICVAKADGKIDERQRNALTMSLADVTLPSGTTLDGMLKETIDLDAQLAIVKTPEAGERLFQSALAVAHAGVLPTDKMNADTRKVVDRIREHFKISPDREKLLDRLWSETKDTVLPSNIQPITDAAKRSKEVDSDVIKYSVMSAVLGSFPVPGVAIATDMGVVALQVKMVRDIGQYWGHKLDRAAATSLLGGLGLGTGMRIAVTNLAKLVPGWGSVVGGTASFASTWALGKVARKYFESGMKADVAGLKTEFQSAEKEGRAVFAKHETEIESKRKATTERLEAMQADLESGKITRADYEVRLANLT
jgi:uncharacterized protein (DUF697 family)